MSRKINYDARMEKGMEMHVQAYVDLKTFAYLHRYFKKMSGGERVTIASVVRECIDAVYASVQKDHDEFGSVAEALAYLQDVNISARMFQSNSYARRELTKSLTIEDRNTEATERAPIVGEVDARKMVDVTADFVEKYNGELVEIGVGFNPILTNLKEKQKYAYDRALETVRKTHPDYVPPSYITDSLGIDK